MKIPTPISGPITQLNYENGKTNLKLIESANYLSLFTQLKGKLAEKFEALTTQIEADLEIHFGISLGIDIRSHDRINFGLQNFEDLFRRFKYHTANPVDRYIRRSFRGYEGGRKMEQGIQENGFLR